MTSSWPPQGEQSRATVPEPASSAPARRARRWRGRKRLLWALSLGVLCTAAFALRAYHLDAQSLWSDESISLERAGRPLWPMVKELPIEHAPLYFVLLAGWLRLAGSGDFALRFPSLLAGTLTVPLVFALGRRVSGNRVGLLAGILYAGYPLGVWYSQEARMYALVTLTGAAALWFLVRALGGRGPAAWLGYILAALATAYTHYYGGLVLATGVLYGLLAIGLKERSQRGQKGANSGWPAFLAAQMAVGLLYLPWLPRASGVLGFPGWRPPLSVHELASIALVRWPLGPTVSTSAGAWFGSIHLLAAVVGLMAAGRELQARHHREAGLLVIGAAVAMAAGIGVVAWRADIHERYLLPMSPLWCLAIAWGLVTLWQRARPLALLVVALISGSNAWSLANHYFDPGYAKPDYRAYTAYILERATPDDGLILYGPGYFLTRRYGGPRLPKLYNLLSRENRQRAPSELEELLTQVAARHATVWLAVQGREPGAVGEWLARHGFLWEGGWRSGILLFRYVFPPLPEPGWRPVTLRASRADIRLAGFAISSQLAERHLVLVAIRLEAAAPREGPPLRLSARLLGPQGTQVASMDVDGLPIAPCPPGQGAARCSYLARIALPLDPPVQSGLYQVEVVAYRALAEPPVAEATLAELYIPTPAIP